MSEIVQRSAQPLSPSQGMRSTAQTSFTQRVVTWDDLPAAVRATVPDAMSTQAAAMVDAASRTVRRDRATGQCFTPWIAWRASRQGVTLLRLRSLLAAAGPRTYRPTGQLVTHEIVHYAGADVPRRRRGTVAVPSSVSTHGHDARSTPVQDSAEHALSFLPTAVQLQAHRDVPTCTQGVGEIIQYSHGDLPYRQRVALLRLSDDRALVLVAERECEGVVDDPARFMAGVSWNVTQYLYEIRSAGRAINPGNASGVLRPR